MSRERPAIVWELACSMLRDLSGYKGYPKPIDSPGEHHFIRAFQESVISVEHAQAVVDSFDQEFPTVLHIRESAFKLRARFESSLPQRAAWEREYGSAKPFDVSPALQDRQGREIDRLWQEVLAFLRTTQFDGKGDIQQVPIGRCWQIAKHLGYPMNGHQSNEIKAYEYANPKSRESLPVKRAAITQADIDAVKRDVKVLASGDDSDRWE